MRDWSEQGRSRSLQSLNYCGREKKGVQSRALHSSISATFGTLASQVGVETSYC